MLKESIHSSINMQHVSVNLAGGLEAADAVWTSSTTCLPKTVVIWHKILHTTDVIGSRMKLETEYLEKKRESGHFLTSQLVNRGRTAENRPH